MSFIRRRLIIKVTVFILLLVSSVYFVKVSYGWWFDANAPTVTFPNPSCTTDPCYATSVTYNVAVDDSILFDTGIAQLDVTRSITADTTCWRTNASGSAGVVTNPDGSAGATPLIAAGGLGTTTINIVTPVPTYFIRCVTNPVQPRDVVTLTVNPTDAVGNTYANAAAVTISFTIAGPWYQVNNAAFHKKTTNTFTNLIPALASPPEFAIGEEGIVTSASGSNMNLGSGTVSNSGWNRVAYGPTVGMSVLNFIDYIRERKDTIVLSSPYTAPLSSGRIYIITPTNPTTTGLFINTAALETQFSGTDRVVFIVNGNITFGRTTGAASHIFNSGGNSVAFLSTGTIRIHSDYTGINAILMANDVDFAYDIPSAGPASNRTLAINGNLITGSSAENLTFEKRLNPTVTSPTVSINFNPLFYMELMPYLSTTTYEWRQTQ